MAEEHQTLNAVEPTAYRTLSLSRGGHVLASDEAHGFELVRKPYPAEQVGKVLRAAIVRKPKVRPAPSDA
ncbi:hypothetical protein [Methylorubrum extorquens]|jgi:hypothetical protein